MAKNSHIEWTHHTFNPWWGCKKVSAACDNCYAELWAKRTGHRLWGSDAPRRFFGEGHWREPLRWNEDAGRIRQRHRVFCASMADVFERRNDLTEQRERLWELIQRTPNLDWLLLTKRPQNIAAFAPWSEDWPDNVWIGTSVENQTIAEKRLPFLLRIPAKIRFVSCEPLLGPLDLHRWFTRRLSHTIDWVIVGGESGHNSRPMHPDWAAALLHQCESFNVPFLFKQWGHWAPADDFAEVVNPELLTLRNEQPVRMVRVGKKLGGRILNGMTWDDVPQPSSGNA